MKCTNKLVKIVILIIVASLFTACSKESAEIWMPFSTYVEEETSNIHSEFTTETTVKGFSSDLCVFISDNLDTYSFTEGGKAGLLIDLNNSGAIYSEKAFDRLYPASLTKVMTAYLALKYGNLNDTITCSSNVSKINVPGAVLLGLSSGDRLTLDQALHLALLSSYNDVAVAIAEYISGSVDEFARLMNEEALKLGATGTHFVNPHGLPDDNHYTTAYDLYLIFNAALQYPTFSEIIQAKEYRTVYTNKKGKEVTATSINTNMYFRGSYKIPEGITLVGGKTGTTDEAGCCLMLLVRDKYGYPYISIMLGADTKADLYEQMSDLLIQLTD